MKSYSDNFFVVYPRENFCGIFTNVKILPGMLFIFALILLGFPDFYLEMPPSSAVWSTFLILVFLSMIAWLQVRNMGENPWISPLFIHMAVTLSFQTAAGLLLLNHGRQLADFAAWGSGISPKLIENLPKASWLVLLGGLGAYIGLIFPVPFIRLLSGWIPPLRWNIDNKRFALRAGITIPLFVTCYYLSSKPGILPENLQQLAWSIGQCGTVVFIAGVIQILMRSHSKKPWIFIIGLWFISYTPMVLSGVRSAILFPIVFFNWAYLAVKDGLTRKHATILLTAIIVFILILYPVLTVFKNFRLGETKAGILEASKETREVLNLRRDILSTASLFEFLRTQTLAGQFVPNYVQYYPDSYSYLEGESFFVSISAFIPRILYPDKSDVWLYINKLSFDIGMGHSESLETSSTFIDAISEFYINLGPWGVFLLSILHGIVLQARYDWLIRRSSLSLGFPIFAAGFITPVAFWHIFILDSKNFIVWILFLWLLSHRNNNRIGTPT